MAIYKENNKKSSPPVTLMGLLGKLLTENEKTIGVVLSKEEIQICQISKKKNIWKIENYFYSKLQKLTADQNFVSEIENLSSQIRNFISQTGIKTKDAVISIPGQSCLMITLQIPKMPLKDMNAAIEIGGFWEQFDTMPKNIQDYNISYQLISTNDEIGIMEVGVFCAEKKMVDEYLNIIESSGLNPVIVDIGPIAQLNSLSMILGNEVFDNPIGFLNYGEGENYIAIGSNKAKNIIPLNIVEADKVLLDTVEEVDDVTTTFWDEIFERLASQIKNALIEFETKYETSPIKVIFLSTSYPKCNNFITGIEKQLAGVKIKLFSSEDILEFSSDSQKNYNNLPNKSMISEVLGLGMRKFNVFDIEDESPEKFKYNLLPRFTEIKNNRKYKILSKASYVTAFLIIFAVGCHMAVLRLPTIYKNNTIITKNKSIDLSLRNNETNVRLLQAKSIEMETKVKNLELFGSNKLTTSALFKNLNEITPKGIRITNFEMSEKKKLKIEGVSIDDASIINFASKLSENKAVENVKTENILGINEKEDSSKNPVGTPPAAKTPLKNANEITTKQFVINLTLKPIEGEKFYDQEKIAALLNPAPANRPPNAPGAPGAPGAPARPAPGAPAK
jgi:Tfp pilus assembly PilM family ATPase